MKRREFLYVPALGLTTLAGCAGPSPHIGPYGTPDRTMPGGTETLPAPMRPPALPREFRAAWVSTVANIDWPSTPGLSAAQMQAEALAILDRASAIGLNALVLQIRPSGDAIYPSSLEPWCEYLSGAQGRAPWHQGEQPWDPLAFWIEHAHRRGLALHAWFNPYRARHSTAKSPLVAPHLGLRRPELVRSYGEMLWADPGEPAAAAHLLAVVADVLRRYDIDGVHVDDYFYPYPVNGQNGADLPFPDDASYGRYRASGGRLARDDWRRSNVDTLVRELYDVVRTTRPGTLVGISPFGIGRPDRRPPGIRGFSQYDQLYADVERWLSEGWLDYLAPQLYWPINQEGQRFPVLLDYWLAQNTAQRHIWPGLFTSQVVHRAAGQPLGPRAWPASELLNKVALQRASMAASSAANRGAGLGASGHMHFSMVAFMQDRDGIASALRPGPYATPALQPLSPWIAGHAPAPPQLRPVTGGGWSIEPAPGRSPRQWAVWYGANDGGRGPQGDALRWRLQLQASGERRVAGAGMVVVHAVDHLGRASTGRLAVGGIG